MMAVLCSGHQMQKSDLPFGSEFSPSQINLRRVLELAEEYGGNWRAFEKAVQTDYFDKQNAAASDDNRAKLANNTKLGMQAYGLLDDDARLTEFGREMFARRGKDKDLYKHLAQHILLNLHGSTLLQCIQDMQRAGDEVTLISLREILEARGVHVPRGGRHLSTMRLWLEKAGVFDGGWRINEAKLEEVRGLSSEEMEILAKLNVGQRYFLRTYINIGCPSPYPAREIEKLATATFGHKYNEKGLAKDILYPLEKAGYVSIGKTSRAKSPNVSATPKLFSDVYEPLLGQLEKLTGDDLRPFLRKPLNEIFNELSVQDRHVKGLALEALAVKLMRLVGLEYVATRLRGTATGGAEVDVIFQSLRLAYSRWQVQCKNTVAVSLDDVAKEVGLTHMLRSSVIVVASTGAIGPDARRYAATVMRESNLAIVLIDRADIETIIKEPVSILDVLGREAKDAMKLKKLEL